MSECPDCGAVAWGNATCATCRAHWPNGDPIPPGYELAAYQRRLALEARQAEERRAYRRRIAEAAGE